MGLGKQDEEEGKAGGVGAAHRPPQGHKKEKLSILSLSLSCLELAPAPSFVSRSFSFALLSATISKTKALPFMCQVRKEMLVEKKGGGGSEYKTMLDTYLTTCREIFPSF